jgi:hypothetical protein
MKVALPVSPHPLAYHQSFSEIHEVQPQPLEVDASQSEHEPNASQVAGEIPEDCPHMSLGSTRNAVGLHAIGARCFCRFLGRQAIQRAIRRIDGRRVNAKTQFSKLEHFP